MAEVALHFNFLFVDFAEVALRINAFKNCCGLIVLRFQFFRLVAQFHSLK